MNWKLKFPVGKTLFFSVCVLAEISWQPVYSLPLVSLNALWQSVKTLQNPEKYRASSSGNGWIDGWLDG